MEGLLIRDVACFKAVAYHVPYSMATSTAAAATTAARATTTVISASSPTAPDNRAHVT